MYHKNFKHLQWIESIEVARPTICGFDTQKITFFRVFLRFSEEAHELIVPAKPPNTYHRPRTMPKEPTDLLNLPRRWTISGIQNVILYYKIDIVTKLFWWLYNWSLSKGYIKHLTPCFYFQ